MNRKVTGSSTSGVLAFLVLVVLALGGLYLFNERRPRGRDDQPPKGPTLLVPESPDRPAKAWTPAEIVADPPGYLDFCERKTLEARKGLDASSALMARSIVALSLRQTETVREIETVKVDFSRLKEAYREAESANRWPLSWKSRLLSMPEAKQQILAMARQLELKRQALAAATKDIETLKGQEIRAQKARDECQDQLTKIATSREVLRVRQITDELKRQLLDMRTVLNRVTDDLTGSEKPLVTLDEIAAADTEPKEKQFEKVMKEK